MELVIIGGRSHPGLSRMLAAELGLEPGRCLIEDFPDGEIGVSVQEDVAGRDVAVLQSTAAPAGSHLLELLLLADACRRRGARRLIAVIPYFGLARQDRRVGGEEAVGARVATDLLATRFDHIVAVDLHNPAIEGFSSVPLWHVSAVPCLAAAIRPHRQERQVVVAPDVGAVAMAQRYGALLRLPVAYVEKVRQSSREVQIQAIAGEVKDRIPVLVDDMISTGGTMAAVMEALLEADARRDFRIIASHCLLVGDAAQRLGAFPVRGLITSDSLPTVEGGDLAIERVGLASLLGRTLRQLCRN